MPTGNSTEHPPVFPFDGRLSGCKAIFRSVFCLAITALFFSGCATESEVEPVRTDTTQTEATIPFDVEGTLTFERGDQDLVTIDIEIAETDSSRERGLMQRSSLPAQSGMLFIFEREEPQDFWMANTPLSLDIFFVDADFQIVNIARYTRPYSSDQVSSVEPAMYVVETVAGFADTYGITESDQVRWTRIE